MGLFDDLLGGGQKTTSTVTTPTLDTEVATPSVDPMLVMEEQTTSTPAPVDDILNMSAGNVTPEMPSYTERKAAERASTDTSAILISETPTLLGETALMESAVPAAETPSMAEMTPVMLASEAVTLMPDISLQTEAVSTVSEAEVAPVLEVTSPVVKEEAAVSTPEFTADMNELTLFTESSAANAEISTREMPVVEASEEETSASDGLLSFGADLHAETSVARTETHVPADTASFLVEGLAQLEAMEVSLAEKKQAFLNQAEQYRQEKERFAELEETALADSRSVDDEQSRIKAMKSYFQNQQKKQSEGSELTESVSTALTGMSVQNAVGNTIEKKPRKTPAKKQAA